MDYFTDEGDLHVCGFCKQTFKRLNLWLEHKQLQWCKTSYRVHNFSQHPEMVAHPSLSSHDRPFQNDSSQPQDMSTSSRSMGSGSSSSFAVPIKRSLYPIMPRNRKRERARPRKQDSPQPLVKLEKSSPTINYAESLMPASPPGDEKDSAESALYKRPRGRPRKESNLSVIVSPGASSSPIAASSGLSLFSPEQTSLSTPDISSHSRRPLVLPRVYSCPRCSKSFIKLSHLHRHMNKKKPCEAKDHVDAIDDNSETEELVSLPSKVSFTCGLCSEIHNSYDDIISHHSEKHPAYYPGYCRFCGKFQDRKNKLLIHLVKHDHSQIVDEVAQEVKRIRHIKIDKPSPASQLNLSAATSGSSLNLAASAVGNNLSLGSSTLSLPSAALPTSLSTVPQSLSQPHASQAVDTLVVTEVTCPCCQSKFSDKDELVCHFRDFHAPIGCSVSEDDINEMVDENSVNVDSDVLRCFICCLKFLSQESLDFHMDYHKVWSEKVTPHIESKSLLASAEGHLNVDENKNTSETPNNEAVTTSTTSAGSADAGSGRVTSGPDSESYSNSEDVMDLSMNKKLEKPFLLSSSMSLESNGSPEERVALDYPCWLCTNQHAELETLREHVRTDHGISLVYRCVVADCRLEFHTWSELSDHEAVHSQKAYVCKVCNDHQPSPAGLANHSKSHKLSSAVQSVCTYCQSAVDENMELHRMKCSQQLVSCPECNEKVKRLSLMKHVLSHTTTPGKSYRCEQCDSTFNLRDRLTQHIKNVHGPRKFVCNDCGAAFKRNDKLQRHCQSRHSDIKPYLCPIVTCGRAFKRIDGLRAHVRCSHVTEALAHLLNNHYGCTVCGKLVSGQEKLVDHLMSHVKASPPSLMSSSLSGELFGTQSESLEDSRIVPSTSSAVVPHFECPHCHIKVANEALFYAHLVQHSQVAFRSPTLPFSPNPFFFPFSHNTTSSTPKME